jgi:hypothetical protein
MESPNQTIGRMAARDAASLLGIGIEASADRDMVDAMKRIIRDLNVHTEKVKYVYPLLLKHLRDSELNINFFAYKFFNKKPEGEKYVSQFEGGNTWGDPTYMTMRDEAEEAMFDYSATRATLTQKEALVQQRLKVVGKRDEDAFEGVVRPKYAALNYARLKYGAAGQWGKSYMVLKEYVKTGATYVHTDTFDISGSARQRATLAGQVANFLHMQRLIMPTEMLKALDEASRGVSYGEQTQPRGLGDTCYIEAHVHSDVQFKRDIQKMVINQDEVDNSEQETQKLYAKDQQRWKVISSKKLKARLEKFAHTYGITLAYT